jgi:hypothetical protein
MILRAPVLILTVTAELQLILEPACRSCRVDAGAACSDQNALGF